MNDYMSAEAVRDEMYEELAFEQAAWMEKVEDARFEERQKVEEAVASLVPASNVMMAGCGAGFAAAAYSLWNQDFSGAVWFLALGLICWGASRLIRRWKEWYGDE